MIFYITVVKALASIIITNSHYTSVYPNDLRLLASGGLLGDVMFFAVSGFVLINIRDSFPAWYWKKIVRIYPSIWIITLIYLFLGFYSFDGWSMFRYFVYPTYYHFIASMMVLLVPYYLVVKVKLLSNNVDKVMIGLFLFQLILYIFFYDKSYYRIDTVREPMVRFLFFQSMMLGLYFRQYKEKFINRNKVRNWIMLFITLVVYLLSKLAFVRIDGISEYQILNQIILFAALYFVLRCFAGIDWYLEKSPLFAKNSFVLLARITLEIYAVQYVIIPKLSHFPFPLNWLLVSTAIVVSAFILHIASNGLSGKISNVVFPKKINQESKI